MNLKPIRRLLLFIVTGLFLQACAHEGPYRGRVIEEEGGRPVAGAVVVGYWTSTSINVGGGTTRCIDARETVSDERGDFEIPPRDSGIFSPSGNLSMVIYKVGYQRLGPGPWESLREALILRDIVKWEGDRAIIPLVAVPKSRLKYEGSPPHISCGRKDGKPMEAWHGVRQEYKRAIGYIP
jgi:hypothetical protein